MADVIHEVLKIFEENDLFEEGVELIGSWCFDLYQKHLGVKKFPFRSLDIDFLIPYPYKGEKQSNFIGKFEKLGFKTDFKSDGSVFLWNPEIKIEFLTCEKGKGADEAVSIKELGIKAIPLRFVSLLLEEPITIEDNGIKILVPNPVNFCLQKIIIASRRKKEDKKLKDLEQAIYTSAIIKETEMNKALDKLPNKWRADILKTLQKARTRMLMLTDEIDRLLEMIQSK